MRRKTRLSYAGIELGIRREAVADALKHETFNTWSPAQVPGYDVSYASYVSQNWDESSPLGLVTYWNKCVVSSYKDRVANISGTRKTATDDDLTKIVSYFKRHYGDSPKTITSRGPIPGKGIEFLVWGEATFTEADGAFSGKEIKGIKGPIVVLFIARNFWGDTGLHIVAFSVTDDVDGKCHGFATSFRYCGAGD